MDLHEEHRLNPSTSSSGGFLSHTDAILEPSDERVAPRRIGSIFEVLSLNDTKLIVDLSTSSDNLSQLQQDQTADSELLHQNKSDKLSSLKLGLVTGGYVSSSSRLRSNYSLSSLEPIYDPTLIQQSSQLFVFPEPPNNLHVTNLASVSSNSLSNIVAEHIHSSKTEQTQVEPTRRANTMENSESISNRAAVGLGGHELRSVSSSSTGGTQNPTSVYEHIHQMVSKRISTMDYLKKAHQGRVYWYNTILTTKEDIAKLPSFEARKLARRTTNFFYLSISMSSIWELNSTNPNEYLRSMNALMAEFETYQQLHPIDGSNASSLSRAKIPQMFKRSTYATNTKPRRSSSAADIGLPMTTSDPADPKSSTSAGLGSANSSTLSFGANERDLLPGEEYQHLMTPWMPFDPDYFQVFLTLCDMVIDCYLRVKALVPNASACVPGVGELFGKMDAKMRKFIVHGIVKELEDNAKAGIKNEIAGISKVVMGGLV